MTDATAPAITIASLADARVAVWGAGREGRAAAEALRRRLPSLDLTIIGRDASQLPGAWTIDELEPDAGQLGAYDVVVKSPGISPYRTPVPQAVAAGVRFTSGTALWFAEPRRAPVIAITGTKGKSTTSALTAHLLRASGRRVALAGNIGVPLLELLDVPVEPDAWVIELSSFQTREVPLPVGGRAAVDVGVVLNLYPEHLDWHGSVERYFDDKRTLLARSRIALGPGETGAWRVVDGHLARGDRRVVPTSAIRLPGAHNATNACAALAAIEAAGFSLDEATIADALSSFRPLPHRLQPLGLRNGLDYVNDSISTTPHATLAALAHYADREVTLIVGGYDRGVDWSVVRDAFERAAPRYVVAIGQAGDRILDALAGLPPDAPRRTRAPSLEAAMALAQANTPAGGVVLLSPGSPSFGEFKDYVDRGRRFAALAAFDPTSISAIEGLGL